MPSVLDPSLLVLEVLSLDPLFNDVVDVDDDDVIDVDDDEVSTTDDDESETEEAAAATLMADITSRKSPQPSHC